MPTKAKIITRSATSSSVSADNLGKGSELTFNELDSNLINLRDASIGFASDDSTTTSLTMGDTLKIAGGTGITTAVSGDTLTVTAAGGADLGNLEISNQVLSGKTTNGDIAIRPNGTGDVNLDADTVRIGDEDATAILHTHGNGTLTLKVGDNADNKIELTNAGAQSFTMTSGQNATFNLGGAGTLTVSGGSGLAVNQQAVIGGISIDDNEIATTTSNADLELKTSGTGNVTMSRAQITGGTITGITDLAVADGGTGASSLTDNAVLTGTGTSAITAEGNLSFNGSTLAVTGAITATTDITATGSIANDAVSITDNVIKTSRSNDSLRFQANGTGQIEFSPNGAQVDDVFDSNTRYDFGANRIFSEQDADASSIFSDSGDRRYSNGDFVSVSLSSSTSNSHARWRSGSFSLIDMKGNSITSSARYFKGVVTRYAEGMAKNTNTSTASTLNNMTGVYSSLNTTGTDNGGGLTVDSMYNFVSDIALGEGTSETVAVTNAYYNSVRGSSGDGAITNEYGYHIADSLGATNKYAFWDESNSLSMFGAVILQNQSGDPSGVTDTSHIYAKDDGGSSEVHVRDEAGNVTKISPHNDAGEWEFYSKNTKTGKTVRINMERAIQVLEKLSGEKLIEGE